MPVKRVHVVREEILQNSVVCLCCLLPIVWSHRNVVLDEKSVAELRQCRISINDFEVSNDVSKVLLLIIRLVSLVYR